MELVMEIQSKYQELEISVKRLRHTGEEYAEAERTWRKIRSQKALELRSQDMAIGMIDKVLDGISEVADAKFEMQAKEAVYKANQEHINATKLLLRILENQYNKEYFTPMSS